MTEMSNKPSSSSSVGAAAASGSPFPKGAQQRQQQQQQQPQASTSAKTDDTADAVQSHPVDADSMNVELLPILHDIIRVLEKDNQDVSQKNKDSLEASHKIQELQKKIESMRDQIYQLPGIERSKPEQLHQLQILRCQLEAKRRLLAKYKDLNLKVAGLSSAAAGGGGGGGGGGAYFDQDNRQMAATEAAAADRDSIDLGL